MKHLVLSLAIIGLALSGCQTASEQGINPSGAYPDVKKGNVTPEEGRLILHRDVPVTEPGGQGVEEVAEQVAFTVFDQQGRLVKRVSGSETLLPAGRYLVRVEGSTYERQPFWVTIESGRTVEVDVRKVYEHQVRPPS